ncbi:site-2 protease family protein [Leptolyngbya sp. AN03gr2]|uniref:site-2 protease family protein n=1 Tax=unclassified Leptolyngbya TaxID=2650499 RepID=UPI003D31371C
MDNNIRVGSLFGIPFYVNPSWFLVLGLVTFSYGSGLAAQFPNLPPALSWGLGLLTALLLFGSVLAHELGHSFVALKQGVRVKSITLFLFGGLASLEKESETPAEAFQVAIAGPLVSLLLAGLATIFAVGTGISGAPAAILSVLVSVNLALALFNLIPGLPLDGGNILKALVWKVTGSPYKGMKFAGRVGQLIGWLAIASGLLPLVVFGSGLNFWNILIGWFLLQNASQAARYGVVLDQLAGLTAADAVSASSPVVNASSTLREFADQRILDQRVWQKFLVTNSEGQLIGTLFIDDLKAIPSDLWSETLVQSLVKPLDPSLMVQSDRPLSEVVTLLEERKLTALSVVQENNVLVGLLEKTAIVNLLQNRVQAAPA